MYGMTDARVVTMKHGLTGGLTALSQDGGKSAMQQEPLDTYTRNEITGVVGQEMVSPLLSENPKAHSASQHNDVGAGISLHVLTEACSVLISGNNF